MLNRALIFGLFLVASQPGSGIAQVTATDTGAAPTEHPLLPDGTSKQPNNVPEIVRAPDSDPSGTKAATDPQAALEPPAIETAVLPPAIESAVLVHKHASRAELVIDFRPWAERAPLRLTPEE